ncbi:MAG: PEP-CTERM sorting domain-containing protein [Gemmatimonadaceae bacterium]|nr:PEP-CTERM sorting domain-containing protein [Gemmatimonadaceae bacterium]
MKLFKIVAGAAAVVAMASPLRAQQVTLNFDDLGVCTGTPLTTYGGWLSIASGVTCQTGPFSVVSAASTDNYLRSAGNMDWTFLNGPVVFNGLYASGYGSFFLDLMSGGNVVYTRSFGAYGSNVFVGPNSYSGQVDRVRVRIYQGYAVLGVDDIAFTPTQTTLPTPGGVDELVNQPNATPEPATLLLVASGLGGVGALARRRRKA